MDIKWSLASLVLFGMLGIQAVTAQPIGTPVKSISFGVAQCFEASLQASGVATNCEVSGVVKSGNSVILANDKAIPGQGRSAIFSLPLQGGTIQNVAPTPLVSPTINLGDKYEALTSTLDGAYIIASTAFGKVGSEQSAADDRFNNLVYWPAGKPENAKLIEPSSRGGVTSSRALRAQIQTALGTPYFQIEGLSVIPGALLLGIRKAGKSSDDFKYVSIVLAAPMSVESGNVKLTGHFYTFANLRTSDPWGNHALGLSAIEYDRFNTDRIYLLTSYEDGLGGKVNIGGFLWAVPITAPYASKDVGAPVLIRKADGGPLVFSNKPEGIEVLNNSSVIVVHDDDRESVPDSATGKSHRPNEFAFSVISF